MASRDEQIALSTPSRAQPHRELRRFLPPLAGILAASVTLLLLYILDIASQRYATQRQQTESVEQLSLIRARLESELNTSIFLTHGLAAYVATNPAIDKPGFNQLARELLSRDTHIRHLAIAPNNVISAVYPVEGNEPALGLDLTSVPEQRAAVERAIERGTMVVTGPINLIQGGQALATREPVFIHRDGERHYWGLVTAVIRTEALFGNAGLPNPNLPLQVAIRSMEPGQPMLLGSQALFEQAEFRQIVQLPGTEWEIAAVSTRADSFLDKGASRAFGILLALLAGVLIWRLQLQSAALRASERKYRNFIEHLNDGVCIAQDGVIRFANPRVEAISGYPREQLIGMPIETLVEHGEDQRMLLERHRQRMRGMAGPDEYELRIQRADGQIADVRLNSTLVEWEGRPAALGTVTDITERRQLETALHESRNRLAAMIRAMPDISFILDEDGRYLDVFGGNNVPMYSSAKGLIGQTLRQALPADLADLFLESVRRVIRTGRLETIEYQLAVQNVNGTPNTPPFGTQWFEARIAPLDAYPGDSPAVLWLAFNITQHKNVERELRQREAAFQALVENSPDVISRLDRNLRYIYINSTVEKYTGVAPQHHIGRKSTEVGIDATTASLWENHYRRAFDEGQPQDFEFRMMGPEGKDLYFESRVVPEYAGERIDTLLVIDREITERKHTENQLRLAASVFQNTGEAMLVADARRNVVRCNPAYTRLTGRAPESVIGKPCPYLHPDNMPELLDGMPRTSLAGGGHWEGEITAERGDRDVFPAWMTVNTVRNEHGVVSHYLVSIADISSRKRWEQQLRHEATHDPLTALPNRTLLMDRLTVALALARRSKGELAVLFVDLDEFKPVNDALGHRSGDLVLRELAFRMRNTIRETDTVARFGGDEFVILISGPEGETAIAGVADTLLKAIAQPIEIHGHICNVSASIGISRYPHDAEDGEGLLSAADHAMYTAKATGRGRYMFYSGNQPPTDRKSRPGQ
ncbi:MAG: PAS domain S-box protein [Aquisalimonadaceae bacterium]